MTADLILAGNDNHRFLRKKMRARFNKELKALKKHNKIVNAVQCYRRHPPAGVWPATWDIGYVIGYQGKGLD